LRKSKLGVRKGKGVGSSTRFESFFGKGFSDRTKKKRAVEKKKSIAAKLAGWEKGG